MRLALAALPALLALAACEQPAPPPVTGESVGPEELALFGDGYPNPGDPCRRSGETAVTNPYLDDASDLVACPPTTDAGLFSFNTNASQVGTYEGWYLFSVPRR